MPYQVNVNKNEKLEDLKKVCEFGVIRKPTNLPAEITQAYNLVKIRVGNLVGWSNQNGYLIDYDSLIDFLDPTINIYIKIRNNILREFFNSSDISEEDFDNSFSDAAVFRYGFSNNYLQHEIAKQVTLVATCIRLGNFHKLLNSELSLDYIEVTEEETLPLYTRIIQAQLQLLAAQDLLIVSGEFNNKILNQDEIELHNRIYDLELNLAKKKSSSAKGGRSSSMYREFESQILNAIRAYKSNRDINQTAIMESLAIEIDREIPSSTFNNWLKNYNNSFGQTIFKV
jgi:hypothetical protein